MTRDSPMREEVVRLELPAGQAFHAVGRLVVGGVGTRAELRVDQIEDLQLAVDALLSGESTAGPLGLTLSEDTAGLRLTAGPLAHGSSERSGLDRMLRTLVGEVVVQDSHVGEWISMRVARAGDHESS